VSAEKKKPKVGGPQFSPQIASQFTDLKKCLRLVDPLKCSYLRISDLRTKSISIICGFVFCGPKFSQIRKCPLINRLKKLFFKFAQYTKFCRTNLRPNFRGSMKGPRRGQTYIKKQCCGSGSGTGSVRIRNFWPDPDPIRNRNKHFGSGFESGFESGIESGSETGSEKKSEKMSLIFRLK
jgi:hypothetical protein